MSQLLAIPCKTCLAPIFWADTDTGTGKKMPLNAKPTDDGNIIIINKQAHCLKAGEQVEPGTIRWQCHWATCNKPAQHRRRKS